MNRAQLDWLLFSFVKVTIISTIIVIGIARYYKPTKPVSTITINNATLFTEHARTPSEFTRGLSGREYLPQNTGLLFHFPTVDNHIFWMKDMKFPIDIIWIHDSTIVYIEHSVPNDDLTTYKPLKPSNLVLETNAGWAKKNNIQVGDSVLIKASHL